MIRIEPGHRGWIAVTAVIMVITGFVVGRSVVHSIEIRRQIRDLERQKEAFEEKIAADSTLVEQLRFDDYLEEYARERFLMQRPDEKVYITE